MIETKDITKMVAHILKRDKGIADTHMMHPVREWGIGLLVATGIVAVGSLFCVHLYQQYSLQAATAEPVIAPAVPYHAASIEAAITQYEAKAKKFTEIVGGVPVRTIETASSTEVVVPTETEQPIETPLPVPTDDEPTAVDVTDEAVIAPVLAP